MNQIQRDMKAVLTILKQGPATFSQIALQAGEGLTPAIQQLVELNKIVFCDKTLTYKLIKDPSIINDT